VRFKELRVEAEWNDPRPNPLLKKIVTDAAGRALERWNWEFLVTCIYRTPLENDVLYGGKGDHLSGVHTTWRGVDVRTIMTDPAAILDITTTVNDEYQYDADRQGMRVALPEGGKDFGSTGAHLHFQVSPATVSREEMLVRA
jgi:hypothetical protein